MKNIEKYTNTKEALEAWKKSRWVHKGLFANWLNYEYIEPKPPAPTLLEAAKTFIHNTFMPIDESSAKLYKDLEYAIVRETQKPVRNCDRYRTADGAHGASRIMCKNFIGCKECPFESQASVAECTINWLYAEAEKDNKKETDK